MAATATLPSYAMGAAFDRRARQVSSGPPLVRNSLALPFLPRAE